MSNNKENVIFHLVARRLLPEVSDALLFDHYTRRGNNYDDVAAAAAAAVRMRTYYHIQSEMVVLVVFQLGEYYRSGNAETTEPDSHYNERF